MIDSRARLRDLVRLNNELTSSLDLPTVLQRIVEIGVELVQAQYGAMGVVGDDRRLEQFIHVGMSPDVVADIDHLPEGKGLLGALIDDPRPVRLPDLSADDRSSGFPAHHPPMTSFIGVPIRVLDVVFGNLYLTDSRNGTFSEDDEELAQALAATAAIAIGNARLFEDSQHRARWSTDLADLARALVRPDAEDEVDVLLDRLPELADCDLVGLSFVDVGGADLVVQRTSGPAAAACVATTFAVADTVVADVLAANEPRLVGHLHPRSSTGYDDELLLASALLVPFAAGGARVGVLSLARRRDRPAFSDRDVEMGVAFASHLTAALGRAETRSTRRRLALLEDRSRIARDLHDHVIQQLFGTGLNLQAVASTADPATAGRIMDQVRQIDAAIAQIRQSIFEIRRDPEATSIRLRARIAEIVDQTSGHLSHATRVTFRGPVDLVGDAVLADDMAAVVTESLANAVRHSGASRVDITVSTASGHASVDVVDDGDGLGSNVPAGGLLNLRRRAEDRGGSFAVTEATGGGTRISWSAPIRTS